MGLKSNEREFTLFLYDIVSSIEKINICIKGVFDSHRSRNNLAHRYASSTE